MSRAKVFIYVLAIFIRVRHFTRGRASAVRFFGSVEQIPKCAHYITGVRRVRRAVVIIVAVGGVFLVKVVVVAVAPVMCLVVGVSVTAVLSRRIRLRVIIGIWVHGLRDQTEELGHSGSGRRSGRSRYRCRWIGRGVASGDSGARGVRALSVGPMAAVTV